jgi:hypothetical protein
VAITAPSIAASGTAVANPTGQWCTVTVTGGTVQGILSSTVNPPVITTPSIPASTTPVTNTNPFPVSVAVTGGTTTHITVNGSDQGTTTPFTAVVPAGGTIAITYSVVPTSWVWTPLVAGIAGSPVASPFSVPTAPGCSVTLLYTVAPTWAWNNPVWEGYTPGYYAMNTQASQSPWSPYTTLPYAQHAALAQTGLATGVAN